MAAASGIGFCIDESFSPRLATILLDLKAPGAPDIHSVRDLDHVGVSDAVLMLTLAERGPSALVTRDSSMLAASVRRDVWRIAGVSLFLCDGKWGNLPLFDLARCLIWWWPEIVQQAVEGPQGGAWRVPTTMARGGLTRLFADP